MAKLICAGSLISFGAALIVFFMAGQESKALPVEYFQTPPNPSSERLANVQRFPVTRRMMKYMAVH